MITLMLQLFLTIFIPLIDQPNEVMAAQVTPVVSVASGNWNSPSTWGGGVLPTANNEVTIAAGHVVTLNITAGVAALTIADGAELRYLPSQSITLQCTGNVVVHGLLVMQPDNHTILHMLRFTGINEANFVGGGMNVIASDVGLWVMGNGRLDLVGSAKTAWTRLERNVGVGATQARLAAVPDGWQVGDEISIVPTENAVNGTAAWSGFDVAKITAITGNLITFDKPTTRSHPGVFNPFTGLLMTAEVLNLTRNVRIQGTGNGEASPTGNGRAHIFIHSTMPQNIRYVQLRYLGPRQFSEGYTAKRLGRYALHFHMAGDGSRGSLVEGVVCRDVGSHCFVPHASHGITFLYTIGYNGFGDMYWWDDPPCKNCPEENVNDSNDITYDYAVAALVRYDPDFRGVRLGGFALVKGNNLAIRNSVAVGVQGTVNASGFNWPEKAQAVWIFENNISHNNKITGAFVWQNNYEPHLINGFVAYHNLKVGFDLGAYRNNYDCLNCDLFANGVVDVRSRAASGGDQNWLRLRAAGFEIAEHALGFSAPILVKDCVLTSISVNEAGKPMPGRYDFVNCTKPNGSSLEPTDVTIVYALPSSVYRVQRPDGTAWQMTGAGVVTTIAPFYGQ